MSLSAGTRKEKLKIQVRTIAPMQEIADSIYEMLKRVSKLDKNDRENFEVLKKRIRSQAFCLQGVLEDPNIKGSEQFENLMTFYSNHLESKDTHPLVKECIEAITDIINNKKSISEKKYKKCKPSAQVLTNFFRSKEHIEKRMELSEEDPETYLSTAKMSLNNSYKNCESTFKQEKNQKIADKKGKSNCHIF